MSVRALWERTYTDLLMRKGKLTFERDRIVADLAEVDRQLLALDATKLLAAGYDEAQKKKGPA